MVGTLIVAAYAGTTAAGVAASFALTAAAFAVNFAVSQIVTRMFMDNPESQQDMGVREQVPPSNVNAIPIVYGEAYMGGTFVDAVLTTDQRKMYYVLAISSISPNGQFTFDQTDMYYGDQLITFSGVEPGKVVSLTDQATNLNTKIDGNLFIYLFTSNQAGTITPINSSGTLPSGIMGGADIAVAQRWPASGRQMNGLAFAIVVLNYNRDANTTSLQPITFHVSHTLNSTGVAKPGDVWYDYITNPIYGGAVDAAFVDSASATALNAYSDATIPYTPSGGGSATQARYRINGVLDAGQTVLSNLDRIMSSCDSWMTYNAALGQWSVVINKSESTAYAFTDNNIIGDIRVSASDITASINQVEARFPFKENRDQANFVFLALQELNPALLYPNEPVNKYSITYDLVNDSVQATYLANRLLEQAREDLNVIFNTTYYGIQVDAGNVVSVTNADYGWNAKLFRVMKVMESSLPDGSLGARLELSEYNAAVYDDENITQFSPVANSGLPSVSYFSPLSAPTVVGYPTVSVPNFSVTVLVPTTGRVTYGNLFYTTTPGTATSWKLLATAESANSVPVINGTSYTFLNQVLSASTYYFAYVVGNDVSQSILSPASTAFVWAPIAPTGPTGPSGPTGNSGPTGATGDSGLSALTAYRSQSQTSAAPATPSNTTGATAPAGWSLTAPSVVVGNVLWYSFGQYNSSGATISGIPAGQTQWGAPTAASVFQDIRSDNWNGGTPPTTGPFSPLGTAGYYIQQATGNMYLNSIYGQGVIRFDGNNTVSGGIAAAVFNQSLASKYAVFGTTNVTGATIYASNTSTGTQSYAVQGQNTSTTSAAVYGYNYAASGGIGVYGEAVSASSTGVYGAGSSIGVRGDATTGVGVRGFSLIGGIGVECVGSFKWGSYTYVAPSGSTSTFLRNDGSWATPSGGSGTVTSVSGIGSVSGISLSGTVTTSGNLSLGGSLSLTTSNLTATAPSAGVYLSGTGWNTLDPVMTQAGTNSGTATVSSNILNIYGSTSTGIVGAYVGTSASGNTVTLTVQTGSPSDIRLKEEIADTDLGLAFVKQLRPVSYKLKADPKHQKGYGFIAQEVESLIGEESSLVYYEPDWKVGDETGFKTIHYPSYIAVLTKAIQELSAQVEELKKQISKV
jgi:hypothetical protein